MPFQFTTCRSKNYLWGALLALLLAILGIGVVVDIMAKRKCTVWAWGDGVHDDTEVLRAAFSGIPGCKVVTVRSRGGGKAISYKFFHD